MSNNNHLKQRLKKLLEHIGEGLHEREQALAVSLLGSISGQNIFLYGPPGTAKSLISRRLSYAFKEQQYFEYLMNRFSTPEEVFGPVSIKELKEDNYIRKVDGYLPTADFAFLDEIWKSSPAILNTLLTLINENTFKNGNEIINVPLKSLIAASNEVPVENQGLEALYDRFIIRLPVFPISEENNFIQLLNSKPSSTKPNVDSRLTISQKELANWRNQISKIKLSPDTLLIIKYIRIKITEQFDDLAVYVSDRRWQKAATLLKTSAFCNNRNETNHTDTILLKHCLWTTPENQPKVSQLVMDAIKECGLTTGISLAKIDNQKEELDEEINKELFHNKNIYNTTLIDNKEFFKFNTNFNRYENYNLLIPYSEFKSNKEFNPLDQNGNPITRITCLFDNQGTCNISHPNYRSISFTPEILFHKGDKKTEINKRLIKSLAKSVRDLHQELIHVLQDIENKLFDYKSQLDSPFVTEQETDIAVAGIKNQINQIKLRIKDCERLESLCK